MLVHHRSFRPSLTFWFSRIARYAPSPARSNLTEICDPCINIFCGMGSKSVSLIERHSGFESVHCNKTTPESLHIGKGIFDIVKDERTEAFPGIFLIYCKTTNFNRRITPATFGIRNIAV